MADSPRDPAIVRLTQQVQQGQVARRDFLRRAVALGCTSSVAYQLLSSLEARAQNPGPSPSLSPNHLPSGTVTTQALGEEGTPAAPNLAAPKPTAPSPTAPNPTSPPTVTTYAIGEENQATTYAVGEENNATTFALGEETNVTTFAVGEENNPAQPTTRAVGEESPVWPAPHPQYPRTQYPHTYLPPTYYQPSAPRPFWRTYRRWPG